MMALDVLLGDARAEFERDVWPNRQQHLFVRGVAERFPELLEDPRLDRADTLIDAHLGAIRAQGSNAQGEHVVELGISADAAKNLLRFGVPIQLVGAEKTFPALSSLLAGLRVELGQPTAKLLAMIFLSPPGRGIPKHFDQNDVWVVGLRGTKSFWVAPNHAIPHVQSQTVYFDPAKAATVERAPNMPEGAVRIDVGPGDCLFLPRGYFHETASEGAACWSLTVGMHRPTVADLCVDALRAELMKHPELRAPLPGLSASRLPATEALAGEILARLPELVARMSPGSMIESEAKRRLLSDHRVVRGMSLSVEGTTVSILSGDGEVIETEMEVPPALVPVAAHLAKGATTVSLRELLGVFPAVPSQLLTGLFEGLLEGGYIVAKQP